MVCTPGFIWWKWEELAYKRRATGWMDTFRDRKKTRVGCTVCVVTVAASYLKFHMERIICICVP